ncbi:MAG TPA: hypothetical protein DCG49_07545 [Ruminococcus sp.]|nr:hypothetical protein [Ruminococcus sp.]
MHHYYHANQKEYCNDIRDLMRYVETELVRLFRMDFKTAVFDIQQVFLTEYLEQLPYIGGSENGNDTNNLVKCCEYAAVFVVGRRQGCSDYMLGKLLHFAEKRRHKHLSKSFSSFLSKMLQTRFVQDVLRIFARKSADFAKKYPYAWQFEYEAPDAENEIRINCTRCGAYQYLTEKGMQDIMPYLCNLDYVTAQAYHVPYYRDAVIAYGDACCANKIRRNAPVVTDNWPPHGLRKDGLK